MGTSTERDPRDDDTARPSSPPSRPSDRPTTRSGEHLAREGLARSLAVAAPLWAAAGAAVGACSFGLLGLGADLATPYALGLGVAGGALGSALASRLSVRRAVRRLDAVARFLEMRIAATSSAVRREHEATQRERQLTADLARKRVELEQRLRERQLLFDVLRESTASHDLSSVLTTLVERLGPALALREVAVLLREGDRLVARAAWGFAHPERILGRALAVGEGLTGEAAARQASVLVPDVAVEAGYLAFWGEATRDGAFLGVPLRTKGELVGMLAVTRPDGAPFTEVEQRYLEALGHPVALAIRSAQLFAELEASSTLDALTSLPNRRLFESRLAHAIADAKRFGHAISLLAIDVDHFKQLNDRNGHPAGDAALVAIARTLAAAVREVDTAARIGGEEFAVILVGADEAEALRIGDKLRRRVAALETDGSTEQPLGHLSISVGVARLLRDEGTDPAVVAASLVARADAALYEAKRLGRDRVCTLPKDGDA